MSDCMLNLSLSSAIVYSGSTVQLMPRGTQQPLQANTRALANDLLSRILLSGGHAVSHSITASQHHSIMMHQHHSITASALLHHSVTTFTVLAASLHHQAALHRQVMVLQMARIGRVV